MNHQIVGESTNFLKIYRRGGFWQTTSSDIFNLQKKSSAKADSLLQKEIENNNKAIKEISSYARNNENALPSFSPIPVPVAYATACK